MNRIFLFVVLSIPVIVISGRTLFNFRSHGFYRFFSWECILWLFASNYKLWFKDPFSLNQIVSWIFLVVSAYMVITGVVTMKKRGKPKKSRTEKGLYQFEKTTNLVDSGIFRYIRHPLYSSLLILTWGICLKNPTVELLIVSLVSGIFLYLTALHDEKECKAYFGQIYSDYMKKSKMFIPFLL
jgi:protein-S-isoprenylcysteine O-methyltransferase Ste14